MRGIEKSPKIFYCIIYKWNKSVETHKIRLLVNNLTFNNHNRIRRNFSDFLQFPFSQGAHVCCQSQLPYSLQSNNWFNTTNNVLLALKIDEEIESEVSFEISIVIKGIILILIPIWNIDRFLIGRPIGNIPNRSIAVASLLGLNSRLNSNQKIEF